MCSLVEHHFFRVNSLLSLILIDGLTGADSNGTMMDSNAFGDRGILQRRSLRDRLRRSLRKSARGSLNDK